MLKNITIRNFMGIEDYSLNFNKMDNLLIFSGKNGSGKTSFINALYYGLTGKYNDKYMKEGADEMSVSITLDTGDEVKRVKGKDNVTLFNGSRTTQKSVDEFFISNYGFDPSLFKFLNIDLSNLTSAEITDFLLENYINAEIPREKLIDYANNEELTPIIERFVETPTTIFSIQKDVNDAKKCRTQVRNDIKKAKATLEGSFADVKEKPVLKTGMTEENINEKREHLTSLLVKFQKASYLDDKAMSISDEINVFLKEYPIVNKTNKEEVVASLNDYKTKYDKLNKAIQDDRIEYTSIKKNDTRFQRDTV